jgi:hypothetical protein
MNERRVPVIDTAQIDGPKCSSNAALEPMKELTRTELRTFENQIWEIAETNKDFYCYDLKRLRNERGAEGRGYPCDEMVKERWPSRDRRRAPNYVDRNLAYLHLTLAKLQAAVNHD